MAEVSRDFQLDILHVHYAVPHATAAILARSMLPPHQRPRIITTLHGTDTTLLGNDRDYAPAIRHALANSDAITTVSQFLKTETQRLFDIDHPIDVIHNFFEPRPEYTPAAARRSREAVRRELGVTDEVVVLHASNLRPLKRIDLLLETVARIKAAGAFKLLILAGGDFSPYLPHVKRLGLQNRIIVRDRVPLIEEYLQAADLGLFTSESESFCLSILEAMCFGVASVSTRVGGIPEVVSHEKTGLLVPLDGGDPAGGLAHAVSSLIADPARRSAMGQAAQQIARTRFTAAAIVPQYEGLYRRVLRG